LSSDGRENYPSYAKLEKPDKTNVEPYTGLLSSSEVGPLKWTGDLRLNKTAKNHRFRAFKYANFEKNPKDSLKASKKALAN
jgi:hypothetical protein